MVRGIPVFDALLGLLFVFLFYYSLQQVASSATTTHIVALGISAAATVAAMVYRRTNPVSSAVVVYAAALLRFLTFPTQILISDVAVLVAMWAVVAYGPKRARPAAIGGAAFGALLLWMPQLTDSSIQLAITMLILLEVTVLAVAATAILRAGQLNRISDLVETAQTAQREAEREAELAVVEERTRIAREMHDIVAHTLSVVIAQADGGQYAAKSDPSAAVRSLEVISEMTRDALADIRSIIGVLRDPDDSDSPLTPQPVEEDITNLVDHVRESGYNVSFLTTGSSESLPVGLGNALFRIAQEALTNAMKHAGPNVNITVSLAWTPTGVTLKVIDDGRGAGARNDGHGHGLIGMEERAAVFGGTVEAGPRTGGGFEVIARIPTHHTPHERNVS